jgi:predicted nucleic acid-binding protein
VIVLDAGVLIGHLRSDDRFHDAASEFLAEHEQFDWAVSAMTLAESLVHAVRAGRGVSMIGTLERLAVLQLDIASRDALGLAEVRASSELKMPDAIVLYTAERHGGELVTTNGALARAAEARGVTTHLLEA